MRKLLLIGIFLFAFPTPADAQDTFTPIWSYSLAGWAHMPIIQNGIVYNAWTGGKLAATNLKTGQILRTADGVASATAPFIVGNKIYGYKSSAIHELDLNTFQKLRSINIPYAHYTENIPYDAESGYFYARQADYPNYYWGRVSAFNLSTGQIAWSFPKDFKDSWRGQQAPLVVGDSVYIFFAGAGKFSRVNKFTGQEIWTADLGNGSRNGYNNPIYDQATDYFFVSESWNSIDSEVNAVRRSDGKVIWTISIPGRQIESTLTAYGNAVYLPLHVPSGRGSYRAVNAQTGQTIWEEPGFYNEDGWGVNAVSEKYLYRGTHGNGGQEHLIVQNRHTGDLVWSYSVDCAVPCTNPVQSDGIVIIGTCSKLWALQVGTGQPVNSGFHGLYASGYNPGAIHDGSGPIPTPVPSPTSSPTHIPPSPTSKPPSPTPTLGPSPTPGGTVISNLQVNDANLWRVLDNLQPGVTQYTDRSYTLNQVDPHVIGSNWLQTANASKSFSGTSLATFNLSTAATVYVAHDDRVTPKPSWLSAYTDTGMDLVNSEAPPVSFSLYAQDFPAGTVTLGDNGSSSYGMYTLVVKETGTAIVGDTDADGDVDIYDYYRLLLSFPQTDIFDLNRLFRTL